MGGAAGVRVRLRGTSGMLSRCSLQLSSIWSSVIVGQVWVWVGRRSELRLCIAVATDGRMKTILSFWSERRTAAFQVVSSTPTISFILSMI